MLNQTLTQQTLTKILRLKQIEGDAFSAITLLLKDELAASVLSLIEEDSTNAIYRSQGAADKLKELIHLFETPKDFKEMFNE